jgi:hypothetical protein
MTEPAAKFSGEMSIVAKAAGVGDLAERLACSTDLKDSEVVVHAIEANIPVRPLDPVSIATHIQCREPQTLTGRTQPVKALGSIPSGLYRPHMARSRSLHAS